VYYVGSEIVSSEIDATTGLFPVAITGRIETATAANLFWPIFRSRRGIIRSRTGLGIVALDLVLGVRLVHGEEYARAPPKLH